MIRAFMLLLTALLVAASVQAQPARRTFGSTYLDWDPTEKAVFVQSALQLYIFAALDGCRRVVRARQRNGWRVFRMPILSY